MIRILFLAVALIMTALPAAAQNRDAVCRFLPVEELVKSAEYVPGVDVNNNPVVPADLKAQAGSLVDVIRFPVTVDLAQQLKQQLPAGTEMDAPVAMIEIYKDSRVLYNGQDLTTEVYALCGKKPLPSKAAADTANREPEKIIPPQSAAAPKPKPVTEDDIIWGEGY